MSVVVASFDTGAVLTWALPLVIVVLAFAFVLRVLRRREDRT